MIVGTDHWSNTRAFTVALTMFLWEVLHDTTNKDRVEDARNGKQEFQESFLNSNSFCQFQIPFLERKNTFSIYITLPFFSGTS